MGQISTGIASSAANPSGSGNYIFSETPDVLSVHLKNLNEIDEAAKQRQATQRQKLATTSALIGDINPDVKGALETDIPDLQSQTHELHRFLQQGLEHGFDPSNTSPQNRDFKQKLDYMTKQIELNAVGSASAKEMLKNVDARLAANPDKYDLDATNKRLADFRSLGMAGRQNVKTIDDLVVPKKSDLLTLTKEKVFKDIPLDSESVTKKDPVTGGFITETKETYSPNHIKFMAQGGIANPEIQKAVMNDYDNMDANKKLAYEQQAKTESAQEGRNVTPMEISYRDFLDKGNPKKEKKEGLAFTPQQHAYWNHYYDNQNEEQNVKYIAETLNKALTGDKKFWGVATESGVADPVASTMKNVFDISAAEPTKTFYSNALNGLPLGNAVIPVDRKDGQGNPYTQYSSVPNRVLNMKLIDGKPFIQTDESLALGMQGSGDGWEKVDDRSIDKLVLGSKNPTKAAAALRKTLLEMSSYPNKNVDLGSKQAETIKLSGKINPSTLEKGKQYEVNGSVYTWDGSKLQPK